MKWIERKQVEQRLIKIKNRRGKKSQENELGERQRNKTGEWREWKNESNCEKESGLYREKTGKSREKR